MIPLLAPASAPRHSARLCNAWHHAAVGAELSYALKARDLADLVENGERQYLADSVDLQQTLERHLITSSLVDDLFQLADLHTVEIDAVEFLLGCHLHEWMREPLL